MKGIAAAGVVMVALVPAWVLAAAEQPGGEGASARKLVMEGNSAQGVAPCQTCHGADGRSNVPMYPHLAGQYRDYLAQALREYRSGARKNPTMNQQAKGLSDAQIEGLAAYYAERKPVLEPLSLQ